MGLMFLPGGLIVVYRMQVICQIFFSINRGVRQGCPLSPYLFIICIEILSLTLQKDHDVTGIKINGK